jgi:hypothetical protein
MATATKTTKAKATATKAKASATKTQAKKTTTQAKATTQQAERTLRAFATDGVYATVGLADNAVAVLRSLPEKAHELREELPADPKQLRTRLESVVTTAEKEFDQFATRGRTVVEQIANAAATKRAIDQAKAAQTQVKAAATSVRKAVVRTGEAAEAGAEKVGA